MALGTHSKMLLLLVCAMVVATVLSKPAVEWTPNFGPRDSGNDQRVLMKDYGPRHRSPTDDIHSGPRPGYVSPHGAGYPDRRAPSPRHGSGYGDSNDRSGYSNPHGGRDREDNGYGSYAQGYQRTSSF